MFIFIHVFGLSLFIFSLVVNVSTSTTHGHDRVKNQRPALNPGFQVQAYDNTHAICRARVPSTLALSYLVMYGVVILFWLACCPSPAGRICTFSWSSCSQENTQVCSQNNNNKRQKETNNMTAEQRWRTLETNKTK